MGDITSEGGVSFMVFGVREKRERERDDPSGNSSHSSGLDPVATSVWIPAQTETNTATLSRYSPPCQHRVQLPPLTLNPWPHPALITGSDWLPAAVGRKTRGGWCAAVDGGGQRMTERQELVSWFNPRVNMAAQTRRCGETFCLRDSQTAELQTSARAGKFPQPDARQRALFSWEVMRPMIMLQRSEPEAAFWVISHLSFVV